MDFKPILKIICLLILVFCYGMLFGTMFFVIGDWALVGLACGAFWIAGSIYALLHFRNKDRTFFKKAAGLGVIFYIVEMIALGFGGII